MSADDILEQLAGAGAVEAEGGFSIDRERARKKMRQFRLADPRQYVLLLVQAAIHQGASRVEFRIDTDDMEVWFDGEGFSKSDLDDLFVSLFGDRGDGNLRARQELAVGLDGALAINPRWVRVSSHHAGEAATMELRADAEALPRAERCTASERGGTSIHVKQRFRPGLVLEFVRSIRGELAEQTMLEERVSYAEIPILLAGDRISAGMSLGWLGGRVRLEGPGLRGTCGFRSDGAAYPASLDVVHAGVLISTHPLEGLPAGFIAVADDLNLRKDVSQVDVLRDEAYAALRTKVADGFERSLLEICRANGDDPEAWLAYPALREQIPMLAAERIADPSQMGAYAGEVGSYAKLPIWRLLIGRNRVSTETLRRRLPVRFVRSPTGPLEDFAESVWIETDDEHAALKSVFGKALQDETVAYRRALEREAKRLELMARDWETSLGEGIYLARVPIDVEGLRGEVAFRAGSEESPTVHLVYEGKLLETVVLARSWVNMPGFVAVVEGGLNPSADWARCKRDEALARAVYAVAAAVQRALVEIGEALEASWARRKRVQLVALSRLVVMPRFDYLLLRAMKFSDKRAKRWVAGFRASQPEEPLSRTGPHPMMRLPLLRRPASRPVSLYDLRHHDSANPVRVIKQNARRDDKVPGYVLCDPETRSLLVEALGENAVVDGEESYAQDVARAQFLRRAEQPMVPPGQTVLTTTFERAGISVIAGLLAPAARARSEPEMARVRVLRESRRIEETLVECDVESLVLALEWPGAPALPDFSGLAPAADRDLHAIVGDAPERLFSATLKTAFSKPRNPRVVEALRWLTLAVFRSEGDLLSFDRAYEKDGLEFAARHLCKRVGGHAGRQAHARAVGMAWNRLRQVSMFKRLGGLATLHDLLTELRRHRELLVIDEDAVPKAPGEVPRTVLVVSGPERALLERVLGDERLADGWAWVEHWRVRKAFEDRPKVELTLDAASVLCKVSVRGKRLRGELGLRRNRPADGSASIIACRRGREVCRVGLREIRIPLTGVVDGESFGEDRQYASLSGYDRGRVLAACRDALPRLSEALAQGWNELGTEEQQRASAPARGLLALLLDERGRQELRAPGPRALATLALFEDVKGEFWSLEDIVAAHDADEAVYWIGGDVEVDADAAPKLVFVDQPHARAVLAQVCPTLQGYQDVLDQNRKRAARRAGAPRMPRPPSRAFEAIAVDGRGLRGQLWIDPRLEVSSVALGDEDKQAGSVDVSDLFIVAGAIHGPGVQIDGSWTSAIVSQRGTKLLLKRAGELYEAVLDRFDPEAAKRDQTWVDDRSILQRLALRLHGAWESRRKPGNAPTRRLYRRLRDVPLFEVESGHAVRLEAFLASVAELDAAEAEPEPEAPAEPEPEAPAEPEPEPEAPAEPEPEPEAPAEPEVPSMAAISPLARLLDAIRAELRIVLGRDAAALSNAMLDLIEFGAVEAGALAMSVHGRVHIDPDHPVVREAWKTEGKAQARYVSIIASSVYSAFNYERIEITDEYEVVFHTLHARHLAT